MCLWYWYWYIYIILYIYYCITNIILVTITIDTIIRYTYVYIIYMLSCLWSSPKGRHLGIWPLQWMASTQPLWYLRHFHRPSWFPPGIPSAVRFEAYQLPNSKHLSAKIGFFGASRFHEYPLLSPEICGLRRGKRQLFFNRRRRPTGVDHPRPSWWNLSGPNDGTPIPIPWDETLHGPMPSPSFVQVLWNPGQLLPNSRPRTPVS